MASLYPYLILVGVTIIAATLWLLGQARRRARINNELVELNQRLQFDLPDFLRHCWRTLAKAGFRGISWRLDWFGSILEQSEGEVELDGVTISRLLEVDDIRLEVKLFDGKRRFEERYFSNVVAESFFLLLYTDMWVKLGSVQGAFAQTAKLSVFLQHDMKNIVQLISLMAEQLGKTMIGNEDKLIDSLRTIMPTLRDRSERFLSTLSSDPPTHQMQPLNLSKVFQKTADIHDLEIKISGHGEALINEQSLHSICDNIFGNYVDQSRRNPEARPILEVQIESLDQFMQVSIRDKNGKPCQWPERLFEPFWSEKGEGLGIGLYHARQLASGVGGSLKAITPADSAMTFVVNLPRPDGMPAL